MRHARRATALLLATGLGLAAAGCGGSAPAAKAPAPESPTTSAPAPSESPSPSPVARPLSQFESEPQVKAARGMAVRLGRAVNAGDQDFSTMGRFATPHGRAQLAKYNAEEFSNTFPGPQPFTPVRVRSAGGSATITTCWWSFGWSLSKKTGLPAQKRKIEPATIYLKRVARRWQVDDVLLARNSCSEVPVKGRPW